MNFNFFKKNKLKRMKKLVKTLIIALFCLGTAQVFAQSNKQYKIVFQLTSNDTLVHKALIKQISNALTAAPKSKIEVVCHNNGITMLQSNVTKQAEGIKKLATQGVVFAACENTMKERKIDKSTIVSEAIFVPAGIIEIADKQDKKWAYIKAGF
jgi:hypothetical protein